jgi:hypothetical protein
MKISKHEYLEAINFIHNFQKCFKYYGWNNILLKELIYRFDFAIINLKYIDNKNFECTFSWNRPFTTHNVCTFNSKTVAANIPYPNNMEE